MPTYCLIEIASPPCQRVHENQNEKVFPPPCTKKGDFQSIGGTSLEHENTVYSTQAPLFVPMNREIASNMNPERNAPD